MAIQNGVAESRIAHPLVQSFVISTLRQPDPQRTFPDQAVVFAHGGAQLAADSLRVLA